MAITIDNESLASLEGGIHVRALVYAGHFPLWPSVLSASLLVGAGLCVKSMVALVIVLLALLSLWVYWSHVKAHFLRGCLNPGVVVSVEPFLVAVYTDLSTGDGSYPVIKILRHPRPAGTSLRVGMRVATAALYSQPASDNHWADFNPKLNDSATSDREENRQALAKLPERDWDHFSEELSKLPKPYCVGLYPVK